MLNGVPKCLQGRKLHGTVRVLSKLCTLRSSAEMDLGLTVLCQMVYRSMASIIVHSCRIRWGQLFTINNQNCLSMVSFCSRTMHLLIVIIICKVCCNIEAGRCWHIPPTLNISPRLITGCFHMWKNIFGVNDLTLKTISTLLPLPLYIVWAGMNTEMQLIVYHLDGESVWTVLMTTLSGGYVCMCKHLGISVVLLSCILLFQ
jgi:hypothetical protein